MVYGDIKGRLLDTRPVIKGEIRAAASGAHVDFLQRCPRVPLRSTLGYFGVPLPELLVCSCAGTSLPAHLRYRRSGTARGRSFFEEILADYPSLERDDILAAIDYAAYQTDHVVLRTS